MEKNGLKVSFNKQYEFMLGIMMKFLMDHENEEVRREFDFIETHPIKYVKDFCSLVDISEYPELLKYYLSFEDETTLINIALGLNDDFTINEDKINRDYINQTFGSYGSIDDFVNKIKALAQKVSYDKFWEEHKPYLNNLMENEFCSFPEKLSLLDINEFYDSNNSKFNYIPSILMNGGFGPKDKLGNLYM